MDLGEMAYENMNRYSVGLRFIPVLGCYGHGDVVNIKTVLDRVNN